MKWLSRIVCIVCIFSVLESVERRSEVAHLKVSVVIPCHVKHFSKLKDLLNEYVYQTVVPDEVVVSLSGVGEFNLEQEEQLRNLERTNWPFALKILVHEGHLSASANRNRACEVAVGDVFVGQDADDIPHRQRIEAIKWFFEHYDVDLVQHAFKLSNDRRELEFNIDVERLRFITLPEYETIYNVANGPNCISRRVFAKIHWDNEVIHGEDVLFNKTVYEHFSKTAIIYDPLYLYRWAGLNR